MPAAEPGTTDWCRGSINAPVTLIEYGDFECPQCRAANETIRELLGRLSGELRFVFRHFPLRQIHPRAEKAAEAAEAAGAQGFFWEMHDLLFEHQENLSDAGLVELAVEIRLNVEEFLRALSERRHVGRVRANLASGLASGVSGTPTFFINGELHDAAWDFDVLHQALQKAVSRPGKFKN